MWGLSIFDSPKIYQTDCTVDDIIRCGVIVPLAMISRCPPSSIMSLNLHAYQYLVFDAQRLLLYEVGYYDLCVITFSNWVNNGDFRLCQQNFALHGYVARQEVRE